MAGELVHIETAEGRCPAHLFISNVGAENPAIILYMDGLGIRPALEYMARRLSQEGYAVLLPDLFYRFGPYGPFDPAEVLRQDFHAILGPLMATTNNDRAMNDTQYYLRYLENRADVSTQRMGVIGFCMGGAMALNAAGEFPDRIVAVASFHGGNLAIDKERSPHLLADKIQGEVYVAGADEDGSYPPEMASRLEAALTAAGVNHRCEIYAGAQHGWMMPDFPVFEANAAERGWCEMVSLFKRNLLNDNLVIK